MDKPFQKKNRPWTGAFGCGGATFPIGECDAVPGGWMATIWVCSGWKMHPTSY